MREKQAERSHVSKTKRICGTDRPCVTPSKKKHQGLSRQGNDSWKTRHDPLGPTPAIAARFSIILDQNDAEGRVAKAIEPNVSHSDRSRCMLNSLRTIKRGKNSKDIVADEGIAHCQRLPSISIHIARRSQLVQKRKQRRDSSETEKNPSWSSGVDFGARRKAFSASRRKIWTGWVQWNGAKLTLMDYNWHQWPWDRSCGMIDNEEILEELCRRMETLPKPSRICLFVPDRIESS